MPDEAEYITAAEAARLIGITLENLRRWFKKGTLGGVETIMVQTRGSKVLQINRRDLLLWIQEHEPELAVSRARSAKQQAARGNPEPPWAAAPEETITLPNGELRLWQTSTGSWWGVFQQRRYGPYDTRKAALTKMAIRLYDCGNGTAADILSKLAERPAGDK